MAHLKIRQIRESDRDEWLRMRRALWPGSDDDHEKEISAFYAGDERIALEVLVAERNDGRLAGFVEVSVRAYAEGCETSDVAYLEGWWVDEDVRREGIGSELVRSSVEWARARGCRELASDTEPANVVSAAAHEASGFEDVGLVRCFRMRL